MSCAVGQVVNLRPIGNRPFAKWSVSSLQGRRCLSEPPGKEATTDRLYYREQFPPQETFPPELRV
jgi:hypothetical protein